MGTTTAKLWAPVPKELHRRVKRLALETDRDMQDIVAEAVEQYVDRQEARSRKVG